MVCLPPWAMQCYKQPMRPRDLVLIVFGSMLSTMNIYLHAWARAPAPPVDGGRASIRSLPGFPSQLKIFPSCQKDIDMHVAPRGSTGQQNCPHFMPAPRRGSQLKIPLLLAGGSSPKSIG
eukprot:COSAG03_NODE_26_length_19032_cov_87.110812_12_plen_120_part_00